MGGHARAPLDLGVVDRLGALGSRRGAHLPERPGEVHRRRTGCEQHLVRGVEVLAAQRGEARTRTPLRHAIAGAPRIASVRIASATSAAERQRSSTSSSGSRRWSSTTTASCSSRTTRRGSSGPVTAMRFRRRPEPGSARRKPTAAAVRSGQEGGTWGRHRFPHHLSPSPRSSCRGTSAASVAELGRGAHRRELEPSDLVVDVLRDVVDAPLEARAIRDHSARAWFANDMSMTIAG